MIKRILSSAAAAALLSATAAVVLPAAASAGTPNSSYVPVGLNIGNLENTVPPIVVPSGSHATQFEQTVTDAAGNFWTDSTNTGLLVEMSAASPHSAVGVISLASAIHGATGGFYDMAAVGNHLFVAQVGSGSCPIVEVNVDPSNLTYVGPSSPYQMTLKNGPMCVKAPNSYDFGQANSFNLVASNGILYFTESNNASNFQGASSTLWEVSLGATNPVAVAYPLSVPISQEMTIFQGDLLVKGIANQIYEFPVSSLSTGQVNSPTTTYKLPRVPTGAYNFADLTGVPADSSHGAQLWFLRKSVGSTNQIGVVPLTQNSEGQGYYLTISNAQPPSQEGLILDPNTGNLWMVSGDVNGSSGANWQFGYFNPDTYYNKPAPKVGASGPTITLNLVGTPTPQVMSADDFALVNGAPTYFGSTPPVNALAKTDNVGGTVQANQSFNYTISPSISTSSPADGYGLYTLTDPMPTGITATAVLPTAPTGTQLPWNCNLAPGTSSAGGSGTVTCTVDEIGASLAPGFAFPTISISAFTTGPIGTAITNTATLTNTVQYGESGPIVVAPPVTASDNIVPVAAPVTQPSSSPTVTLVKTAAQPIVAPGGTDTFSISGTFTGTIRSTATVTDALPAGLTLDGTPSIVSSSFQSASCVGASNTVTCTLVPAVGGISNPSIGTITVPVLVSTTATGSITNTATVSDTGDGIPPVSAQATISVTPPAAAASSASSSSPTTTAPSTTAPSTSTVTVPSTHTGRPWSSVFYWWLVSAAGIFGISLLVPRRRRLGEHKSNG